MQKIFDNERRIQAFMLAIIGLLILLIVVSYNIHKQPWQVEAERIVKKNLPLGTSRARISKLALAKKYYLREPDAKTITVHISAFTMKNKPSWVNDAVAVDVYLDSENKIEGYSGAYGARITMP